MLRRRTLIQMLAGAAVSGCRAAPDADADARPTKVGRKAGNGPLSPLVVRVEAATVEAVAAADRNATAGHGTLLLPAGRYTLPSMRIAAPGLRLEPGAILIPADAAATIQIDGRIDAPRARLFEAAERPDGAPPAIRLLAQTVFPEWWGATAEGPPDKGHDDSLAWQQTLDALAENGGTVQGRAGATYPLRYPIVVLGGGVRIDLAGARLLTDLARNARAPASVLLIGNSREWNLAKVRERRMAGDLFNNFENPAYLDIGMQTEPGRTQPNIEGQNFPPAADPGVDGFTARRCSIVNGRIDYYDEVASPGNYGVQFCNAADCSAQGLRMRNVGQGFGFGSDMAPRVPYAIGCSVSDIVVEKVNQAHTYYGAGFHGYARDCRDTRVTVLAGAPDGSPDGNLWAANFALDCVSEGSGGTCGRGSNGEGFSIGAHARRCTVRGATVRDARRAFVNFAPLDVGPDEGSSFIGCTASDVDYLISLQSKNARFDRVRGSGVKIAEVQANNVNATGNTLSNCDVTRIRTDAVPLDRLRSTNRISG